MCGTCLQWHCCLCFCSFCRAFESNFWSLWSALYSTLCCLLLHSDTPELKSAAHSHPQTFHLQWPHFEAFSGFSSDCLTLSRALESHFHPSRHLLVILLHALLLHSKTPVLTALGTKLEVGTAVVDGLSGVSGSVVSGARRRMSCITMFARSWVIIDVLWSLLNSL